MKSTIAFVIAFWITACLSTTSCRSDSYGYQIRYPGSIASLRLYINNPSKKISYRFEAQSQHDGLVVNSIYVYTAATSGMPPRCQVGIQDDVQGLPSGIWLTSSTFNPNANGSFQRINVQPLSLVSGKAYHIVICHNAGMADNQNYAAFLYLRGRSASDKSVLTDYANGWIKHEHGDPVFGLGFSNNTVYGQPYIGVGEQKIYGSGANHGFGQVVFPDTDIRIKRISFLMRVQGRPDAPCRLIIKDVSSNTILTDEQFCTVSDFPRSSATFNNFSWIGRNLSTPVTLYSGRKYIVWVHMSNNSGDTENCYRMKYSLTSWGNNPLCGITWNGILNCAAMIKSPAGDVVELPNADAVFKQDTATTEISYRHIARVTPSSVKVVVGTASISNVAVEFGETTTYGRGDSSFGSTRHEVELSGLEPGKTYHYRVIAVNPADYSDSATSLDSAFRIPNADDKITVDVIADAQQMDFIYPLGQAVKRGSDVLLSIGDNLELTDYVTGTPATLNEAKQEWANFLPIINPGAWSPAVYMTTGNHDNTRSANCRQAWQESLTLPTNGSSELYYSFDYGPAHFVVLDASTIDAKIDSAQLTWLEQDLAATTKPWKIVTVHYMVKGVSPQEPYYSWWRLQNAETLHSIFVRHSVKLVLQGHRHVYNRYVADGVYYVTTSTLSIDDRQYPFADETPYSGQQSYSNYGGGSGTIPAYINLTGSVKLTITPEQISGLFIDAADRVMDSFNVAPQQFHLASPVNGSMVSTSSPVLSWTPAADSNELDRYELWIDNQLSVARIPPNWSSCIPATPLSQGVHSWKVVAVDRNQFKTNSAETWSLEVSYNGQDQLPPSNPTSVNAYPAYNNYTKLEDGKWYQYSQLRFYWNGANDDSSGVVGYYVYFGANRDADPEALGVYCAGNSYLANSVASEGSYYLRIKTKDAAGNVSPDIYQGYVYRFDIKAPTVPGKPSTSNPTISKTPVWQWSPSSDTGSGVVGYYINVTTADNVVITYNQAVGNTTTWVQSPSLLPGTYKCKVSAVDYTGNTSAWSETFDLTVLEDTTIPYVKSIPDGSQVTLTRKPVTAVFGDCLYIEELDRSAAIQIQGSFSYSIGTLISLSGVVQSLDTTESVIIPASVIADGFSVPLRQFMMSQRDASKIQGLNTGGLLITTAGLVKQIGTSSFIIDDGSGAVSSSGVTGIEVFVGALTPGSFTMPAIGNCVQVTGINGRMRVNGSVYPVIRCRLPSDLIIRN